MESSTIELVPTSIKGKENGVVERNNPLPRHRLEFALPVLNEDQLTLIGTEENLEAYLALRNRILQEVEQVRAFHAKTALRTLTPEQEILRKAIERERRARMDAMTSSTIVKLAKFANVHEELLNQQQGNQEHHLVIESSGNHSGIDEADFSGYLHRKPTRVE
jgi:hypothetical protein